MRRRRGPGLLATVLLVGLAGCQDRFLTIGRPAVHIGSTRLGVLLLPAEFRALHPQLESLFKQPVLFDAQFDGRSIGKQLVSGHLQFAFLSSREFAEIPAESKIELLCGGLNKDGKPSRKALVLASARSEVRSLVDCKGKRFAFGPSGDLLLDRAATAAEAKGGVRLGDLRKELPPLSLTGRLNVLGGSPEIAKVVAFDGGVPCGVVDELVFKGLPETGGSILTGPSRDQLRVIGETEAVPEMVVVAGPKADATKAAMLKNFLISRVKGNAEICKQLDVTGFSEVDENLYAEARKLLKGE